MEDRYLTVDDVARRLRLSKGYVFAQVRAGKIPAIRLGRAVRFDPQELDNWLSQQSTHATAASSAR